MRVCNEDDEALERRSALYATDDHVEPEQVLAERFVIDGQRWSGCTIHDRHRRLTLGGGWAA